MDNKARQARNEYLKQWRKRNKDKIREINKRYWAKVAEKMQSEEGKDAGNDVDEHRA